MFTSRAHRTLMSGFNAFSLTLTYTSSEIGAPPMSRPVEDTRRMARISANRFARRPFSDREASACDQIAF